MKLPVIFCKNKEHAKALQRIFESAGIRFSSSIVDEYFQSPDEDIFLIPSTLFYSAGKLKPLKRVVPIYNAAVRIENGELIKMNTAKHFIKYLHKIINTKRQ